MDVRNKPNIYTLYNAPPPSYAEATSTQPAPSTYNPEFNQRYLHIVCPPSSTPFPYPSNSYLNNTPVQSTYLQNEPERQNDLTTFVSYNRSTGSEENEVCKRCIRLIWILSVLIITIAITTLIIKSIKR